MNAYKSFLRANGLRQVDLAVYLGVTEAAISNIVNGKANMSESNLIKLQDNDQGWDVSMLRGFSLTSSSDSSPRDEDPLMDIIKSQQKTIELQAKTIEIQTQMLEQADREKRRLVARQEDPAGCADAAGE